jgi:pyruvate-formate lyase-activating enzyme
MIGILRRWTHRAPVVPVSCRMADGVYMQADGSLPCYCSGGITKILGKTNGADFMQFYQGATMRQLRSELARGVFPWKECANCHVKTMHPAAPPPIEPAEISILHIEPTSVCNLRCPGCHATDVMEKRSPGRRPFYPLDEFKALIDSLAVRVKQISFCGYGEPLLNVNVPKMIAYAKQRLSPTPSCTIDTNANIRRLDVAELIGSGVNLIRFALDGAIQGNYEQYRRRGNLELALNFIRRVAAERERQHARTKLVWKYVIFDHSSSIEEIEIAIRLCAEIGLSFDYSRAAGILPGAEHRDELVPKIRRLLEQYNVADVIGGTPRKNEKLKFGEEDSWKYATEDR